MADNDETVRRGGCLCGAIRFDVTGEPEIVAHCHCEDCQRWTGAGHSTAAMYAKTNFTMAGDTIGEFTLVADNGNEVTRGFCTACGSPIYGHNSGNELFQSVMLGTLDDSSGLMPVAVIFTRNHKDWDVLDETMMGFETQPGWTPDA